MNRRVTVSAVQGTERPPRLPSSVAPSLRCVCVQSTLPRLRQLLLWTGCTSAQMTQSRAQRAAIAAAALIAAWAGRLGPADLAPPRWRHPSHEPLILLAGGVAETHRGAGSTHRSQPQNTIGQIIRHKAINKTGHKEDLGPHMAQGHRKVERSQLRPQGQTQVTRSQNRKQCHKTRNNVTEQFTK